MSGPSDLRRIAEELLILAEEGDGESDNLDLTPSEVDPAYLARLARALLRLRRIRSRYFDEDLFREPTWDVLLDLFVQKASGRPVSVMSACQAAYVPETTALRFIAWLEERGLVVRAEDEKDRRRIFVTLSTRGEVAMRKYLLEATDHLRAIRQRSFLLFEARP